ncbi:MAG TPA: methyltransferase domain-containing protein [Vicinamibacterales bacterium]|nr:methyltransferase domain-containing protein [Vicinamibacterales bacterium]
MEPLQDVIAYYEGFTEESRLDSGPSRLEFERTKEILARVLPKAPARLIDVGGAAGAYSAWLAERGHEVHLVDLSARLVEQARQLNARLEARADIMNVARALESEASIVGASAHLLGIGRKSAHVTNGDSQGKGAAL